MEVDSSAVFNRSAGAFGGGLAEVKEMALNFELTDFGYKGPNPGTLEARLIELKRDSTGKPFKDTYMTFVKKRILEFTSGIWVLSRLTEKYYVADKKLYASYWIIPNGPAGKAPKAFGVEKEIRPTSIAALYQGPYTPTEDMEMRFCGVADDVLIVRLNSQIVLDGSVEPGYAEGSHYQKNGIGPVLADFTRNVRYGDWIQLEAGKTYDLKILLAEVPGGLFGCFLFYQVKGSDAFKVFSTRPLTDNEKSILRQIHPDVANALEGVR